MLGKARELTIKKEQAILRDVGPTSQSSRMGLGDRSENMSHSRTSSQPSSSSGQDAARSGMCHMLPRNPSWPVIVDIRDKALYQPSYSEFYTYVPGDCSLLGLGLGGSQTGVGGASGSQGFYVDVNEIRARDSWVESRSEAGFNDAVKVRLLGPGVDADLPPDTYQRRF